MGNMAKQLAKKLRVLRGDMSQLQFAKKLSISKSSYHRMEMADQNVTLEMIEYLCKRLKCDIADLFPREDAREPGRQ